MTHWIFQGNPDNFKVNEYLSGKQIIFWTVTYPKHQKMVSVGDTVFLWRAKGSSKNTPGIVAVGKIVGPGIPKTQIPDSYEQLSDCLWYDKSKEPNEIKAGIELSEARLTKEDGMIIRDDIKADSLLSEMRIVKTKTGSNFILSEEEYERLVQLWEQKAEFGVSRQFNWQGEIQTWIVEKKKKAQPFIQDFYQFFRNAFNDTSHPEKAYFGRSESSISLLTGGIYFAAYGTDGRIWLLVDKPFDDIRGVECRLEKSTRELENPLYWMTSRDLNTLKEINNRLDIWESFMVATDKIYNNRVVTAPRDNTIRHKIRLSDFWTDTAKESHCITKEEFDKELEKRIEETRKLSKKERQKRLEEAPKIPLKTPVQQTVFNRNPDVIVEVLERANGICEGCHKPAPFLRRVDNTPYLEVHHTIPLAEGGEDTVDNAVALCPNCHREVHFGKKILKSVKS